MFEGADVDMKGNESPRDGCITSVREVSVSNTHAHSVVSTGSPAETLVYIFLTGFVLKK